MKKKCLSLILTLFCGISCLFLTACDEYKYKIHYTFAYYVENPDGTIQTLSSNHSVYTNDKKGNVLDKFGLGFYAPPGYTFGGFQNSTGLKYFDKDLKQLDSVEIDKNIGTLKPVYDPIKYTFLFAENEVDGKLYINQSKTFELNAGEYLTPNFYSLTPTVENTEFLGWYANADKPNDVLSVQSTIFDIGEQFKEVTSYVDHNGVTHTGHFVILRPKFDYIKQEVAITYNDWGAQNGLSLFRIEVINNQPLPDLTKYFKKVGGKSVYGFSTSKDEYLPFTGKVTNSELILWAMWENYKTVNLHYATNDVGTVEIYELTPSELPPPTYNKTNHTFGGWYENSSFTGNPVTQPEFSSVKSDYYAKWNGVEYALTFQVNGGEEIADTTYTFGESEELPIPVKNLNRFLGWCTDAELKTTPVFNVPSSSAGALTLYAKWEPSIAVSNKAELYNISNNPDKGYYLTQNISLDGEAWTPIDYFTGVLDGCGYKIYDFSLNYTSGSASSYAFIKENAGVIRNLTLDDYNVNYSSPLNYAGVLTAKNSGRIENCNLSVSGTNNTTLTIGYTINNSSKTANIGVVTAYNSSNGIINSCSAYTPISVTSNVQHLIDSGKHTIEVVYNVSQICGLNDGRIVNCVAGKQITVTGEFNNRNTGYNVLPENVKGNNVFNVGGVVGKNNTNATVVNSSAKVTLTSNVTYGEYATAYGKIKSVFGGLVGHNLGSISASYTENVNVSGNYLHNSTDYSGLGGLVGVNGSTGSVANCYVQNFNTTARNIGTGGFVGNNFGMIQKSYAVNSSLTVDTVTSNWHMGGFVGYNHLSGTIRYCISQSIITLPLGDTNVLAQQFAGDKETNSSIINCYYTDESKVVIGEEEQTSKVDNNATTTQHANLTSKDFLLNMLWSEEYWLLDNTNLPTLKG